MVNAVTYCRVSSEEQAVKDLSIPAQHKALRHWLDERPDHALLHDFVDEGESAYAPADKRPGFCEMITYCRRHDVNLILVHKLDRFSRNREESILFKSLLRKHGVMVKSVTENYDPETPQGFLYEGMIEVINQFYSMNLATETVKGMRENAERGYCNGGRVPYGYRLERVGNNGGREHSRLVPGPEDEVAVVRDIFDMAANSGMGGKRITNELNSRGLPAPASRHWNSSTVDSILNNRAYVGDRVWMRSRKKGRDGRSQTPEKDWIVAENAHEPLVGREIFDRRKALAVKRRFSAKRAKGQPVQYLLGRLIRCGKCGHNFVGRTQRATIKSGPVTYHRYYCGGYLTKGRSVCPPFPINRDWIEGLVLDLLRNRICSADAQAKLESRVRERVEARRQSYGGDPKAIDQKLAEIERRVDNYYRAIGEGMDPQVCQQHIAELTAKKETLEEEAGLLRKEDYYQRALDKNLATLRRFMKMFETKFDQLPFDTRRQIVLHFVDHIEVVDHKTLRIHFQVPFDNNGIRLLTDEAAKGGSGGEGESDVTARYREDSSNCAVRPTTGSQYELKPPPQVSCSRGRLVNSVVDLRGYRPTPEGMGATGPDEVTADRARRDLDAELELHLQRDPILAPRRVLRGHLLDEREGLRGQ